MLYIHVGLPEDKPSILEHNPAAGWCSFLNIYVRSGSGLFKSGILTYQNGALEPIKGFLEPAVKFLEPVVYKSGSFYYI